MRWWQWLIERLFEVAEKLPTRKPRGPEPLEPLTRKDVYGEDP